MFVHPTMPAYDISAGDLRTYLMIKALANLGARVTFVSGGSSIAQRRQYVPELEQAGIEVYASDPQRCGIGPSHSSDSHPLPLESLLLARDYDAGVLSHFDLAQRYIDQFRLLSPQTALYLDTVDIHFLRELRQAELGDDERGRAAALAVRQSEIVTCCRCDTVFTVTEDDRQVLLGEVPKLRVEIAPSIHDVVVDSPGFEERDGLLFVGYFGHTPNVDAMRFFVGDVFPIVRNKLPGVKLWIVGSHPTDEIYGMAGDDIEVTGFVPETRPYLDAARISIAPLRYGAGMKGKIGEAMQTGIPVVTTTIGAEGMGLEHDRDALITDSAEEFAEQIVRLYDDRDLWMRLVENAKRRIDERYSTRVVTEMLRHAYEFPEKDRG